MSIEGESAFLYQGAVANTDKSEMSHRIMIAIFFDGTCNNRYNTDAREEFEKGKSSVAAKAYDKDDDSYMGDHTNVDVLEQVFTPNESKTFSIYIEGIATTSRKPDEDEDEIVYGGDTTWAAGTGSGGEGITWTLI